MTYFIKEESYQHDFTEIASQGDDGVGRMLPLSQRQAS